MSLPPRWLRRLVLWPLPVLAVFLYLTTVPLLVVAAFLISYRLPGKLRAVRSLGLATCYLAVEAAVTVIAFGLWIASGFGWKLSSARFVRYHYLVFGWAIRVMVLAAKRLFSLEIARSGPALPADDGDDTTTENPLIVMSRHAGPADSLLLLHEVMSWKGRQPRIVAKEVLQFDPALDILLNRLPNRFISADPNDRGQTVDAIAELASGMTNTDAFVIFPEGGNFTEMRRVNAIARLRDGGNEAAARRAAALRNVLPPRPAGSLAAMSANPGADLVFVAHTGLDQIATVGDLWAAIPDHKIVTFVWQVLPTRHIPPSDEGRAELLYQVWERIDDWVDRNNTE